LPLERPARGYKYRRTPSIHRLACRWHERGWYYDGAARSGRAEAWTGEGQCRRNREPKSAAKAPCPARGVGARCIPCSSTRTGTPTCGSAFPAATWSGRAPGSAVLSPQ